MRALLLFPVIVLAACASTPKDLEKMPIAEVCYLGMTDSAEKDAAQAEVNRRRANCQDHMAEIQKIQDLEARAGGGTPGASVTGGAARSGSAGGQGGGRGY